MWLLVLEDVVRGLLAPRQKDMAEPNDFLAHGGREAEKGNCQRGTGEGPYPT